MQENGAKSNSLCLQMITIIFHRCLRNDMLQLGMVYYSAFRNIKTQLY